MPVKTDQEKTDWISHEWFRYASFGIAAGLLAGFAASFILVGRFFFPSWNGIYLAPVGFLTALDGMLAYRRLRHVGFLEKEWLLYRFSEWVMILLLLKVGYYFSQGSQAMAADGYYLTKRMWGSLFSGEFLFSVVVMLIIWLFSNRFAELIVKLEVNQRLLRIEQETGIYELRGEARENLVSTVLVLGTIMILITAIMGVQVQANWRESPFLRAGVANLLVFFFLTLFLFSLTQLNLMSTIWIREGLTIRKDLVRSWLLTSAVVILFLAVVAGLLPTGYSMGLLDTLNYLVSGLVAIFSYLIFIISAPFFLLIAFLASLFRTSSVDSIQRPEPVLNLPPALIENAPLPWLELLKSILFWLVLAGMLAFAIYYYLHENQTLWIGLKRLALFKRLHFFWLWLSGQLRKTNQLIQKQVQQGWQALRARFEGDGLSQTSANIKIRRLSDREKVFFYYQAMLRRSAERGAARQPWQTPYEYLQDLEAEHKAQAVMPEMDDTKALGDAQLRRDTRAPVESDLLGDAQSPSENRSSDQATPESDWFADTQELTEYFMHARYSTQSVSSQDANLVKQVWERLRKELRQVRR